MRRQLQALSATAAFLVGVLATGSAGAAHWPAFGGDGGRSGFQPVLAGGVPIDERWAHVRPAGPTTGVRTSVLTTAGEPADQRVIFGTDDGRLHVLGLLSGARVGPADGVDVSDVVAPFGSGAGSVTPVETSSAAGLGQIFAVHNDTAGIEIAQLDEATGGLVQQVPVAATAGFEVQSSVLLTGSGDNRVLWFVAVNGSDARLFRVPVSGATTTGAVIGVAVSSLASIGATPLGSPTLVHLDVSSTPTPFVAVGTIDGWLRTYATDVAMTPGPAGLIDTGFAMLTPSVPVTSTGSLPMPAPALYVAGTHDNTTKVFRVVQSSGDPNVLAADVASADLAGRTAPALATNLPAGVPADAAGRVFVTTGANLYALKATDLTVAARLVPGDDLVATSTGFSYTTALATGSILMVTRDNGAQLVLDAGTAQPVSASSFTPAPENAGSLRSFGQPSLSNRFAQFASDRGVFVYRTGGVPPSGYWQVASDGGLFNFGTAAFAGSLGDLALNKPIVAMGATETGSGYWMAASDGGVFAFGAARFFGSTGDLQLNSNVVGFVPTPSNRGYWLVAADGGVFAFGDAGFFGSTGGTPLNKPIVGMAATATGNGYWLVASDGGVFAFGDARFLGSTGDIALNKPVVSMAAMASGKGYWLIASDGGVFAFGAAGFHGSTGAINLNAPIVGVAASATGGGYLLTASDGGLFNFGDAPYLGAAAQFGPLNKPVVAIAAR